MSEPRETPWNPETQLDMLSFYVRKPELVTAHLGPENFPNSIHAEIARIVEKNREKHPKDRLKKSLLYELVKRDLEKRHKSELWHSYKRCIQKIYKNPLSNQGTIAELAQNFAQEHMWPKALADIEKNLHAGHKDNARRGLLELAHKLSPQQDQDAAAQEAFGWPKPLDEAAYQGLAGRVVRLIEPQTESDANALLVQFLAFFGNSIGRHPYFLVESTEHHTNLFVLIVGKTSKARKGTGFDRIAELFRQADPNWSEHCLNTGLSSGEGLIEVARDRSDGEPSKIREKRIFVREPEFSRTLRVQRREGNVLSPILRAAWDGERLQILRAKNPIRATDVHASIVGHITQDELARELSTVDQASGYANRFLFTCAQRSKKLPDGGHVDEKKLRYLGKKVRDARQVAKNIERLDRSEGARKVWKQWYNHLPEKPGMLGAVTARAEAQVVRLSLIYALLEKSKVIRMRHLEAALEVWRYCEDSARHIFGSAVGDPTADRVYEALTRAGKKGMSRTDIRDLLGRNLDEKRIEQALKLLRRDGLVRSQREPTGGRPEERTFVV